MAQRAVAVLQAPAIEEMQSHAPRRLFFEQSRNGDYCQVTIDVGNDLESIRDLEHGHIVVVEGGDVRDTHLCLTSKSMVEMPWKLRGIEFAAGSDTDLLLMTSIPPLYISPGVPGSAGVIGRQCLLINSRGSIVGEGLLGWAA